MRTEGKKERRKIRLDGEGRRKKEEEKLRNK